MCRECCGARPSPHHLSKPLRLFTLFAILSSQHYSSTWVSICCHGTLWLQKNLNAFKCMGEASRSRMEVSVANKHRFVSTSSPSRVDLTIRSGHHPLARQRSHRSTALHTLRNVFGIHLDVLLLPPLNRHVGHDLVIKTVFTHLADKFRLGLQRHHGLPSTGLSVISSELS